jgi:hypothetical protein
VEGRDLASLADRFPDEIAVAVTGFAVCSRLPMDRRIS